MGEDHLLDLLGEHLVEDLPAEEELLQLVRPGDLSEADLYLGEIHQGQVQEGLDLLVEDLSEELLLQGSSSTGYLRDSSLKLPDLDSWEDHLVEVLVEVREEHQWDLEVDLEEADLWEEELLGHS